MKEFPILFSAPMVRAILDGTKTQTRRIMKPQPRSCTDERGGHWWPSDPHRAMLHVEQELQNTHEWLGLAKDAWCGNSHNITHLWVRETFYAWGKWVIRFDVKKGRDAWYFIDLTTEYCFKYRYAADELVSTQWRVEGLVGWWKRPAIFMPRIACRTNLEITNVRVEWLHEITNDDAMAEGIAESHIDIMNRQRWKMYQHNDGVPGDEIVRYIGKPYTINPIESYKSLWLNINGPGSWDANPCVWVIEFRRIL